MARHTGPVCRICRTEGQKLFLKGDRCYKQTCAFERKPYWPGMHGRSKGQHRKVSDFGLQLREKQKIRKIYGLMENQFYHYYELARKAPVTGTKLLQLLESRLDNLVFRMGFAQSRSHARQMVLHGHLRLDGKRVSIPSYQVKAGTAVSIPEDSPWHKRAKEIFGTSTSRGTVPEWVRVNGDSVEGTYIKVPDREQLPADLKESMVVEFFSR